MNLNKQTKKQSGFTIIEVMIVLAVAGLIMAIVFLAIPALQRSNRNTQRKNDATRLAGLIAEYASNNNGKLPTNLTTDINSPTWSFFTTVSRVDITAAAATAPAASTEPNSDTMQAVLGGKCTATTNNTTTATSLVGKGSARQVAVWYGMEPQGSTCISQ